MRVDPVGRAGRQLDAEQERRLGARRDAVDEAILPEQRGVGEPGGIAAIVDRVADDAARQVRVMALADVGAMHIGDAHRDHEVVGDAIGGARRGALHRADAVGVDVLARGRDQRRIAEPAEADVLVEERDRAMTGFQGGSRDGDDTALAPPVLEAPPG